MRTNLGVQLVSGIAMLVIAGVVPCFGQAPTAPPGSASQNQNSRQTLDATVTLTAAFDSDISGGAAPGMPQLFGPESIANSNQLLGNAEYRWAARDVQLRASGTSAWLQDRRSGLVNIMSRSVAAGLTARLPQRTTLVVNQTATYSPSQLYNLFPRIAAAAPGEAPSAAQDYGTDGLESYAYNTQATLRHDTTRRLSFSLTALGEHAETVGRRTTTGQAKFASYGLSGGFARAVARNTRATGQYTYRAGNFPNTTVAPVAGFTLDHDLRVAEQTVEFGLAHTQPLSATRRTVFDVVLGGVVVTPLEQPLAGPRQLAATYRLVGQAGAGYLFRKTWQIGAVYRRRVEYVPGFTEPILADGLTGSIGGWLTRRIEVQASAGYASGVAALNLGGPTFETYTSDVKMRIALGRAVSVYGEYLYYLYDFRRYSPLVPGMPPGLERNGLRFGLTLFVPTLDW